MSDDIPNVRDSPPLQTDAAVSITDTVGVAIFDWLADEAGHHETVTRDLTPEDLRGLVDAVESAGYRDLSVVTARDTFPDHEHRRTLLVDRDGPSLFDGYPVYWIDDTDRAFVVATDALAPLPPGVGSHLSASPFEPGEETFTVNIRPPFIVRDADGVAVVEGGDGDG